MIQSERQQTDVDSLLGQVIDDFFWHLDRGEHPSIEAYIDKYPEISNLIQCVLPALTLVKCSSGSSLKSGESAPIGAAGESPQRQLGDFRILGEIGRGGMGIVYEAEQISMGRKVALKVLPFAAMADRKGIERFKNEVRAAGTLEHPHIVSVYSVGEERGIHYYAMRLIQGHSLAAVIDDLRRQRKENKELNGNSISQVVGESPAGDPASGFDPTVDDNSHGLERAASKDTAGKATLSTVNSQTTREYVRSVANLGVQAAEALAHAHEHGIVHRDVKPANLMLDADAKLYVTDFGLARIEADAGVTMTGDLVGTLRYMSPEQALAKRIVVDHRTDIYSLGVTLYELLTLEPVFDGADRQELLRQIAFAEPRKPRSINRTIPRDIETIVLQAIAKNPDERYGSTTELAEDLGRFLEDQPIHAQPPTPLQRAARWSRHHKSVVAWAAVLLVLATIGSAISSLLLAQERNTADAARAGEQRQREEAERQRDEAERQRQRAEESFRRARDAVDEYLSSVSENELLNAPAMQPLRKDLLKLALKYYQQFITERSDDPALKADLAAAHYRVGKITVEIASKGFRNEALKAHKNALDLRKDLMRATPEDEALQNDLAESHRSVGVLQIFPESYDEASENIQAAIKIGKRLVRPEHRYTLGRSYIALANLQYELFEQQDSGQLHDVLVSDQKALEILKALVQQCPDTISYQVELGGAYANVGVDQRKNGQLDEALISCQKSVEIFEKLVEAYPGVASYQRNLARRYLNLGALQVDLGGLESRATETDDALASYQRAVAIQKKLAEENPKVARYQSELAGSYNTLSNLQCQTGKKNEALTLSHRAIEILKKLAEEDPESVLRQIQVAVCYSNLSSAQETNGKLDEAVISQQRAVEIHETVAKKLPTAQSRFNLSVGCLKLGGRLRRTGELEKAIAFCQKGIDILKELAAEYPQARRYQETLAFWYTKLGGSDGKLEEAFPTCLERAIEIHKGLVKEYPTLSDFQNKLANSYLVRSKRLENTGKAGNAVGEYRKAMAVCEKLVLNNPKVLAYRWQLVNCYRKLAACLGKHSLHDESAAAYREAMDQEMQTIRVFPAENINTKLSSLRGDLVASLLKNEQPGKVEAFLQGQLSAWKELQNDCDDKSGCLVQQMDTHHRLGQWLKYARREDEAESHFRNARELLERAADDERGKLNTIMAACLDLRDSLTVLGYYFNGEEAKFHEAVAEKLERAVELGRKAVQLDPENADTWDTWNRLALAHYRRSNWEGAEIEARLAIRLAADKPNFLFHIAPLLLLSGKHAEYRELCWRLMDNWEKWSVNDLGSAVAMCSLDPNPPSNHESLLRPARRAAEVGPDWTTAHLLRVYCRVGQYEKAIDGLISMEPVGKHAQLLDLAIAHHHAGHQEEARAWLDKAIQYLLNWNWDSEYANTRMMVEVLRREAELLILGDRETSVTGY